MKTLVVLLGPTAVGKTDLSLHIARQFCMPIINADSRQIFREIPIGTAAPTEEQRKAVEHLFVGTKSIKEYYSASLFEQEVMQILTSWFQEHDIAFMSGGSMMYIDAVCNGIDDIPTIRDDIRAWMKKRLETEGIESLAEELSKLDPEHYKIVDKRNPRRVVHALEICHQTGKTYTSYRTSTKKVRHFKIIKIGLNRERAELYNRINERVLQMMNSGLEKEALEVYPLRNLPALHTVGYRELFQYFDGNIDYDEAVRQIQSNSRQYMRKQLTWFKRDECINWYHPSQQKDIVEFIESEVRIK